MRRILIVGARSDGHAKVVCAILMQMKNVRVVGFVDDDPRKKGVKILGIPVLGHVKELPRLTKKNKITHGIAAIGDNAKRRKLSGIILKSGIRLINAIHPGVHLDPGVQLGEGCYLGQGVIVVTGTVIGNAVNIHTGATVDHDNRIEDGANLGPGVHTAGRVQVGKDAFLGTGAVVIPDRQIGRGSIIGAGAVVIRDIPPNVTAVGNPARVI